jgi:hypothetical protein
VGCILGCICTPAQWRLHGPPQPRSRRLVKGVSPKGFDRVCRSPGLPPAPHERPFMLLAPINVALAGTRCTCKRSGRPWARPRGLAAGRRAIVQYGLPAMHLGQNSPLQRSLHGRRTCHWSQPCWTGLCAAKRSPFTFLATRSHLLGEQRGCSADLNSCAARPRPAAATPPARNHAPRCCWPAAPAAALTQPHIRALPTLNHSVAARCTRPCAAFWRAPGAPSPAT